MRNLSIYQFGTLRYVKENNVTLTDLGGVHGGTLGSLLRWKYLTRGPDHGMNTRILVTDVGEEELRAYLHGDARRRLHPASLTDQCARMLRVARIIHMPQPKGVGPGQAREMEPGRERRRKQAG